jgi:hexosaminidase
MVWHHITPHVREIVEGQGEYVSPLPLAVAGLDLVSDAALERLNAAARRILGCANDPFRRSAENAPPLAGPARGPASSADSGGTSGTAPRKPPQSESPAHGLPGGPASGETAGYRFEITNGGITVHASTPHGAVQALASITQGILLSGERGNGDSRSGCAFVALPAATISDAPRSPWRGFMIDVARHFFPISALQELLDIVWLYRLNRFHLHLTDDQGWRFPVAEYPELTQAGAYRDDGTNEKTTYGGSYSPGELRQLDIDAASLGVTVVPEIDLPGHASAALTAYPSVGCTGEAPGVQQQWGIFHNVICASSPNSRSFFEAVYSAIVDTFTGPFIHIGGDEVPEAAWQRCSSCREIDDPYQKIVREMAELVLSRGKRPVAWDEAANLDLPKETIIINWRRPDDASAALARGYDIVLAPEGRAAYLDHKHRDSPHEPGRLGICTVSDSAGFAPESYVKTNVSGDGSPSRGTEDGSSNTTAGYGLVLGGQGNLWTEEIPYLRNVEYMALLRLAVIADGLWGGSPLTERPSWKDDVEALRNVLLRRGYNVYPGTFE